MIDADFQTLLNLENARMSPEALVEYLSEHFPARWMRSVAPRHRFWDAPSAQGRLGFTLIQVTASVSGYSVDVIPNLIDLPRPAVMPLDFAKELRDAVKVAATRDATIVLPEWAV